VQGVIDNMTILIVDANNLFIRSYSAVPSLDLHGSPNGGIVGTLLGLRKILSIISPDKIIFAWDAPGGSRKRRAIVEDYKNGRKPIRLNRNYDYEGDNEQENRIKQRIRLGEYLSDLPLHQIIIEDIEADDVIAWLCQYYREDRKVIVSNDQDFIQLLNDKTIIYNSQKIFVTAKDAYIKYKIHPRNFAISRAIIGDKSDNVKGVYGIGFVTLLKLFPFLAEKEKTDLDRIFKACEEQTKDKYKLILESKQKILDNYKIMRLDSSIISVNSIERIKENIEQQIGLNSTAFNVKLLEDSIKISDNFFQPFRIISFKKQGNQ
jgi:DNA polymerase-1